MKGIELTLSPNNRDVIATIEPLLIEGKVEAKTLLHIFNTSEYCKFFLDESAITALSDAFESSVELEQMSALQQIIASAKDTNIEIEIDADKMSAQLTLISPYMGNLPTRDEIYATLQQHNISRGISSKRIDKLINTISHQEGGKRFMDTVAKGLNARSGKNSYIQSLVPCALERVLTPKYAEDDKIDMRDFGDILCVKKNDSIARRQPPSKGRSGFTVTGRIIPAEPGKWNPIKLGDNVFIDTADENLVLANIAGLPKVSNSKIEVDNVYVVDGVNIATGNIHFDGSVIVNGDINEKMRVIATGDVTVNGFVESAVIETGGDIIITQGASGKLQNLDCTFKAKGSVYIGHAQGISIDTNKDLIVDKQLAYSHVTCRGNITIGKLAKPMGKLFASTIVCSKTVRSGHVGAISGSSLVIDYTEMYITMVKKHEKLCSEYEKLASKNADHEITIAKISNSKPSKALQHKVKVMNEELALERVFLNWLRINVSQSKAEFDSFEERAKVVATSAIHSGVCIKLNNKQWLAKKEYQASAVVLQNKDWVYVPSV